jgi:ferredoxin
VFAARSADDAAALVWSPLCTSNLAALLPALLKRPAGLRDDWTPPRVGVLAKGCVSRSIVGLIKAHQIPREALHIVGVACEGMIDRHRVSREIGPGEIANAALLDGELRIGTTDGSERVFEFDKALYSGCRTCRHRGAVLADETIGDEAGALVGAGPDEAVDAFAGQPIEARWAAFQEEISRCIRCYACREACPNCYCTECFADETSPKWIGTTTDLSDLMLFHLGRAFHQAGRCVDCGACVAACPQGIDLRLLNQKINQDVAALFGYEVSVSLDESEPLLQFAMGDDEGFMTEP